MTENVNQVKTQSTYVKEMLGWLVQIESLNEKLKEVKAEAKEAGFNPVILSTVAKSIAASNTDELTDKSQSIIDLIEELI